MIKDGGPAFPRAPFEFADKGLEWGVREQRGMSLRDWFAGLNFGVVLIDAESYEHAAALAYEAADAMLAERDKSND